MHDLKAHATPSVEMRRYLLLFLVAVELLMSFSFLGYIHVDPISITTAYLPLDALSRGGAVPAHTLLLLAPQAILASAFFLWCGVRLLAAKECV